MLGVGAMRKEVAFARSTSTFKGSTPGTSLTLLCRVENTQVRVPQGAGWALKPALNVATAPVHRGVPVDIKVGDNAVYEGHTYSVTKVDPVESLSGRAELLTVVLM